MKRILALGALALSLVPLAVQAAPPKKAAAPVRYKAKCGMTYSAADAKKNHYICPMDKSKLVPVKTAKK